MRHISWLVLAALLLVSGATKAQIALGPGWWKASAPSSYVGPVNAAGVAPSVCYSIRACSTAVATSGTLWGNLYNTVTTETCDDHLASNGGFGLTANCSGSSNGETVATFCGANCTVQLYSQISDGTLCVSSCTISDGGTKSRRFALLLTGCPVASPCLATSTTSFGQTSNDGIPASPTNPLTTIVLAYSNSTSDGALIIMGGTANIQLYRANQGATAQGILYQQTVLNYPLPNTAWESVAAVLHGASSSISVTGGTPTTGDAGSGAAGTNATIEIDGFGAPNTTSFVGYFAEIIMWNGTGLTSTQSNAVCSNESAYFGLSLSPC